MKEYERCLRCGRKLKSEESKILGFGKVCWDRFNSEEKLKKLFDTKNLSNSKGGAKECQQAILK